MKITEKQLYTLIYIAQQIADDSPSRYSCDLRSAALEVTSEIYQQQSDELVEVE